MQKSVYRFAHYRIDLARRELTRQGEPLSPSVMAFDCIAYLIQHRDRAVGRDEMIAAIWGKADVSYAMLGQLVIRSRRALGGSGDDQDVISTLPRFGYRWVAETIEEQADDDSIVPDRESGAIKPSERPSRKVKPWNRRMLAATLLALASITALVALQRHWLDAAVDSYAQAEEILAVLPVDVDEDAAESWVRLGIMDLIAERLRSAGQRVVPSESTVVAVGSHDAHQAADSVRKRTGVNHVVTIRAERINSGWSVKLSLTSTERVERIAEASAADVTTAAQIAADNLLAVLGRTSTASEEIPGQTLAELLARARSALLRNELDSAKRILESAPPDLQQSPLLRRRLAQVEYRAGSYQAAFRRLEALLTEIDASANAGLRAGLLNDLGVIALYSGQPETAERRFDESLTLLAEAGDPVERGRAHMSRGIAYAIQGEYEQAGPEFALARIAYGNSGDAVALATIELNQAMLEITFDRHAAARPMLERAGAHFDRLGARHELFTSQILRMQVEQALLEPGQAHAIGAQWLPRLDELESPRVRHMFRLEWARALAATGRIAEARSMFALLERETRSTMRPPELPFLVLAEYARFDLATGRPEAALAAAAQSVDALVLPDDARARAIAWLTAVRALAALGRLDEAEVQARRFTAWSADTNVSIARLYAKLAESELADRKEHRGAARDAGEAALVEALRIGVPEYIAEVAESYGTRLLNGPDPQRAGSVIGEAARFASADFRCALLLVRLHHALDRRNDWRAAIRQARRLAGEREIPSEVAAPPQSTLPQIAESIN